MFGMAAALVAAHYMMVVFWPAATRRQVLLRQVVGVFIVVAAWSLFAIDADPHNTPLILSIWGFFAVGGLATVIPHAYDALRERLARAAVSERQAAERRSSNA